LIHPDGNIRAVDAVESSGSSVLDAAAVEGFRNPHLLPFPPGTPVQPADAVVTVHYHPAESGG